MSNKADALGAVVAEARGSFEKCGMDSSAILQLVGVGFGVAGQAGALFVVGVVSELAMKIIESIDLSRINKSRCRKLAERIENMNPVVTELKKRKEVLIAMPLKSYADCVIRAGEIVHKCTKHSAKPQLVRWVHAKGDHDEFDSLFRDMQITLQDLNLAIGTKVAAVLLKRFEEEEGIARAQDLQDIRQQLEQLGEKVDDLHDDVRMGFQGMEIGFQRMENAVERVVKKEFKNYLEELTYQTRNGVSTDRRQNKRSMEKLWKYALEDGQLSDNEKEALSFMAGAFSISDKEEEEIQRKVLDSFAQTLTSSAMNALEYQVQEYRKFVAKSSSSSGSRGSSHNLQGGSSSTVQRIPFEDLVMHESIGRGAFGEVFRAQWHMADVACKRLLEQRTSKKDIVDFEKELMLHSSLSHPCIVTLRGACMEPGKLMIVTDFMERGSLFDRLGSDDPLSRKEALKIAVDVAKGMSYLTSKGVIHRDLKSANVLVSVPV